MKIPLENWCHCRRFPLWCLLGYYKKMSRWPSGSHTNTKTERERVVMLNLSLNSMFFKACISVLVLDAGTSITCHIFAPSVKFSEKKKKKKQCRVYF